MQIAHHLAQMLLGQRAPQPGQVPMIAAGFRLYQAVRYSDSALSRCSLSWLATIAQRGNYVAKHKHNYLSREARENEEATTTGGLSAICG